MSRPTPRLAFAALVALLALFTHAAPALAVLNQVNGEVVPQTSRLQQCLDKPMTGAAPGEGARTVDAVRNAELTPQTFLPDETGRVTFTVLGEGADYQNRFGWYEVGRSPFEPAQRHELFDCRDRARCDCPCTEGPRVRNGPSRNACTLWLTPNTVQVDFNCLRSAAGAERWSGAPLAFYLLTPERLAGGDTGVCAPVDSTTNRVYATDASLNDDGDYLHFITYQSARYTRAYYFGWEDLFRGGDNDFEDLLVRATGLVPACNPEPESCDNRDNNCDGVVDDFTEACSSACGSGTRRCTAGRFGACSAPAVMPEDCNNRDDDCDGETDEGLSRACSGACGAGTQYCSAGAWGACVSSRVATTESCNNVDDDCDGSVDNITRPCRTACGSGNETCRAGVWGACDAPAASPEVCDGRDNDCDGVADDGLGEMGACGNSVGTCRPGVLRCSGGMVRCTGGVNASAEVCDGLDNDCDGAVDDGVSEGGACGRSVGACRAGAFVCEGGRYVCRGAQEGTPERCNNIDDDCDGLVDEDIAPGASCNVALDGTRLCSPGQLRCRAGAMQCEGGTRGGAEVCDCMDNDCDGQVDEGTSSDGLCPGGGSCIACACRTPCRDSEFPCSPGLVCREGFCVPPVCGGRVCRDDEVCSEERCVDPCTLVTCSPGQRCTRGRCVEDSCYVLGCPDPSQVCVDNRCVADRCRARAEPCGEGTFCRDGACVATCADVACEPGSSCRDGACAEDPCGGVSCGLGQTCLAGACADNPCRAVNCPPGRVCDTASATCVDDACARITCPGAPDVVCVRGQCVRPDGPIVEPEPVEPMAPPSGGCACSATPGTERGGPWAVGLLGVLVVAWVGRRRRGRRPSDPLPRAFGSSPPLPRAPLPEGRGAESLLLRRQRSRGPSPSPFRERGCGGSRGVRIRRGSSGGSRGVGALAALSLVASCGPSTAPPTDAAAPRDVIRREASAMPMPTAGCVPRGDETCNGLDDDCDGLTDEDFDLTADPRHCGGCDLACALPYSIARCVDARCVVGECDLAHFDLDRNPANGCEYACVATGAEVCDGRDNDCNGRSDEGFDLQTDREHCGSCDNACALPHATASCVAGACRFAACDPGFVDRDRDPANGCEYACAPSGAELCDGRDNDCDGVVDQGFELQTDPQNCGACGRRCEVANAVVGCAAGACVVTRCEPGFSDDTRVPGADCLLSCGNATGVRGPEVCDGFDNDCNGVIDDGALAGVGVVCGNSVGVCMPGRTVCDRGVISCAGGSQPAPEVCDGLDNDCDGTTDEEPLPGFGAGTTCGTDVGACEYGRLACVMGRPTCTGGRGPTAETCDGVDNDCDGGVDEGVTPPASFRCNSRGGSESTGVCAQATRACAGAMGFVCRYPESYRDLRDEALCDGLDNNCDGRTDEGCLRLSPASADVRLDQGTGNSLTPVIAGSAASLGVLYADRRNGSADLFFARSLNGGTSWDADLRIDRANGTPQPDSTAPALAFGASGFVSAWSDSRDSATQRAVYASRASNGADWLGGDVRVATAPPDQFNVRVGVEGSSALAVWESLGADRSRVIRASFSRDGGGTWGAPVAVSHAPAGKVSSTPALAMGPSGRAYVVWRDDRAGSFDVYFNRTDDAGATWLTTDVRMDTDAAGAHSSEAPSVAADTAGNVYVAWQDTQTDPFTRYDIYTRRSTDFGRTFNTANVRAEADTIPHDSRAPVALAVNGDFVVLWLDERHGRANVFSARSADRGATFAPSSETRVQGNGVGQSSAYDLRAASSNGVVFAVWSDDRDPSMSSPRDVYANYSLDGGGRFQPSDTRLDRAPMGVDSERPDVFSAGGVGHFVWVDRRANGVDGDIYYRSLRP